MSLEIFDFHTHPFDKEANNICSHIPYCDMTVESTRELYRKLNIDHICGAVIMRGGDFRPKDATQWDICKMNNDTAMKLWDVYGDFYIPGFHVHPDYVRESCEEIERMAKRGVKLIGELVPYFDGWVNYNTPEIDEILDVAKMYGMILNVHPSGNDDMDAFVSRHKDIVIVGAHPGEYGDYERNLERMKLSDNYYLDVSGYGIFRHGTLRHGIDLFGAERFLFGSDYPTCNPAMYLGGVKDDPLLRDDEIEKMLSLNAKRLLGRD